MAKKNDNGLFGDGDSKALATAVAKRNETEYAKAKKVTTATTKRGLSGDFSGNKTKSLKTTYSQKTQNIDVPDLSTPKSSAKANTVTTRTSNLGSLDDNTLINDFQELNKALGWRSQSTNSYASAGARADLTRGNNVVNQYLSELKSRGYDTAKLEKSQSEFGSYLNDYNSFFSQFKDEDDYNARYLYPNKYAKSNGKDVEAAITKLAGGSNVDEAELNWLKQNRYSYYTVDELNSSVKQLQAKVKKAQADDEKLARQTGIFLGVDSDSTSALKAQLTAVQNVLRDRKYDNEADKWDDSYRQYFYSGYGKDLNALSKDLQGSAVNAAATVSGELDNSRKATQKMEKYLRSKGYSDEEISSIKAYAQSQNNVKKAYENAAYWQSVADSGFWGKIGASAASIPANLLSGMAFADSALQKLTNPTDAFTGEQRAVDYNDSPLAYSAENMRAAVTRNMGEVGSFLYNVGMSIADFMVAGEISKATGMVGKVFKAANTADNATDAARSLTTLQKLTSGMGNSAELMLSGAAANSAMRSAKERGASDAEALGFGFLNGAAEMFGEHASIENLKSVAKAIGDAASNRTVRNAVKQTLLQSGVEASEEALTTVANTLSDLVIMGDRSEYALTLQNYLAQGESEDDARRHAMLDWLKQLGLDAAAGALSGGVTSGVTIGAQTASAKVRETLIGWEEKSSLQYLNTIATACEYAEGSKTRAFAEELAAKLDGKTELKGSDVKASDIGKLAKLMLEEQDKAPQSARESMARQTASDPTDAFRPANRAQDEPESVVAEDTQEMENSRAAEPEPVIMSRSAQAFEAQGIAAEDALTRAGVVDRLLSGDTVSNRELESIGSLKDMKGVTVFAELTGEPIPKGLTAAKLRKYFRETAAKIAEQRRADATTVLSTQMAQQREIEDAQALMAEAAVGAAFKPNGVDNADNIGYTKISNNNQEGALNAGTQSGVQTADAGDSGTTLDSNGGAGTRLDGLSGGRIDGRGLQERAGVVGREDTELPKVVRLSVESNKSIENSGSASVELDDYTGEPAALATAEAEKLDGGDNTRYNEGKRDEKVQSIIDRLNEDAVELDEVMSFPKIDEIERSNRSATPTINLPNREPIVEAAYQKAMQRGSFDGKDYKAPVRQERRMDIVLGLPGSGKSSVYTERISQEHGARVIDTDDYRGYIPEYNGQNAPIVHEEASSVKSRVMDEALNNGDNILLSTIGANAEKLERQIIAYNDEGYKVYLHLNELPNHKAQARNLGRFFKEDGTTGRYVSPELIASYGDKPTQTYLYLLGRSDINGVRIEKDETADSARKSGKLGDVEADVREGGRHDTGDAGTQSSGETVSPKGARIAGYDWYNNDVNFGEPPVLVESSSKEGGRRFSFEGKTVKLADGTELTYDEFAEQVRKVAPDISNEALQNAFADELENGEPIPVTESTSEGVTETIIEPSAAAEIAAEARWNAAAGEHVTVDKGIELTRGQAWLAKLIASSMRRTGVVNNIRIANEDDAQVRGSMDNGTLTVNAKYLTPGKALNRILGHELLHGTVDRTKTDAQGQRSKEYVDEVLDAMAQLSSEAEVQKAVENRKTLYKDKLKTRTNPRTNQPYTSAEINLLVNDAYIREEVAADEMGAVFDNQNTLLDLAGIKPNLIVRAYQTASSIANHRANNTPEAKELKQYAKAAQKRMKAALTLAGDYETESGVAEVRNSVSDKSWDKQVEMALIANGLKNVDGYTAENYVDVRKEIGGSALVIKDAPAILQELGIENKLLAYTQLHLVNAVLPITRNADGRKANASQHGIDGETLANLPELLSQPVMVLKSRQQDSLTGKLSDSLIAVVDAYDTEGTPVVAVIKPDGHAVIDGKKTKANFITSVYGNENIFTDGSKSYLEWASENDGILYVNSKLADKMLRKIGQKKSAEPINPPENTNGEYSATDLHTAAAGIFPLTRQAVQSRTVSSASNTVSQNERLVKSRFKALAANPYLQNVEFDTVLTKDSTTAQAGTKLPESVMRSEYRSGGELISWARNEDGTYSADETAGEASYLNMTSPLLIECEGRDASRLSEVSGGRGDTVDAIRDTVYSDELMYDGIVLRNVADENGEIRDVAIPLTDSQVIPRFSFEGRQYAPTFYSKLERVVESQKQDKLGASSVVSMLKGKGVKSEEIKWSGIEAFLDGKKSVTKAELLEFVRDNQLQIDTVQQGGEPPTVYDSITYLDSNGQETDTGMSDYIVLADANGVEFAQFARYGDDWMDYETGEIAEGFGDDLRGYVQEQAPDYNNRIADVYNNGRDTRWKQYTLDGGQNYRELLYTMPDSDYSNQSMDVHWNRKGVLAHARVQDFVNAEGKSVLFVEEIQSDWHNAGQKEGYAGSEELDAKYQQLQQKVLSVNAELDSGEMAEIVKKLSILRGDNNLEYAKNYIASTSGHENAFTTAAFNADDTLRAQVYDSTVAGDEADVSRLTLEGQRQMQADAKTMREWQERWVNANTELRSFKWSLDKAVPDAPFRNSYTDFALKNLIRDAAEGGYDMIAWTTAAQQSERWSDAYAEGYRIEYDQDIPSFLKKYGKQWGAKVGYTLIGRDLTNTSAYRNGGMEAVMNVAVNNADDAGRLSNGSYIVHSMDMTDAMRESVLYDGQPRFSLAENETLDDATADLFSERNAIRFSITPGLTLDQFVQRTADKWKASKVRTNTFLNSGLFTRTELQMEGLTEKDLGYEPISERKSMARAQQRLESDYAGTRSELLNSGGAWKGEDLDAAMGIMSNEIASARKTGNYSEVIKWAQRIRERGTNAGQMVQAFAKYTHTPEGALVEATSDLDTALRDGQIDQRQHDELLERLCRFSETLETVQTGDKNALIDLIAKQAQQRNTPISKKTMDAMRADTTQFQFLYDTALAQFSQIAKDYSKTSFGRKVATFQTLSHLLNVRTALRNLGSNNIFTLVDTAASDVAMLPDLLMSAITGKRTVGLDRSRLSAAAREGAKEARNEARIEVALDVAPANAKDKYGTSRRTWKMTGNKFSQAMSTAEKALGFELNYTDESAKGAIRAQVMQSLQPYVDNGTLTAEEAQQFAEDEALYRTFQDETFVGRKLGQIKNLLNDGKDFGLGDIVVKYTQVPGALITRAYEFSPLGYAKALRNMYSMFSARQKLNSRTDLSDKQRAELQTKQDNAQRKAALFTGRASTGTGLIAFFASMAAAGLLSRGDDEDDADAKALRAAMGVSGTQLNMSALGRWITGGSTKWQEGDALASLDFLEPLNSLMAMGTLVAKSDEGVSVGDIAEQSLPALFNAFSELSVMQTLGTVVDTATYYTPESGVGLSNEDVDKWATVGLNVALSGATGFIPAPVRQLAQATDSSNRDAYGERGIWAKTAAQIKNTIPGLRETLPEKQTGFGEPKPTESALLRAVNAFAMPGTISTYKPSAAADELAEVYDATEIANVYPDRNAPYKVSQGSGRDKVDYQLTTDERAQYLRTRGQLSKQLIEAAQASSAYQTADEFTRADMLVEAKNYANYVAKKEFFESRGLDFNANSTYEKYSEMLDSGVDLSSYLAFNTLNNELEADVDEDGDAISGTKKAKTLDLISEQDMTDAQKEALYFKAYPNEQSDYDALDIDFDSYLTYSRAMCTMTGDKDENGKTISGSKKEKVVSLIRSLDISNDAKTQLYLSNGYSAKTLPSW